MKKILLAAITVSILITQTGCFGSFSLIRTVYDFNEEVSPDDAVKSIVMVALLIIPVYEIAGLLDIILFNLIEFWTGTNPIAMKEGQVEEQLMTVKGKTYKVTATKNKMAFTKYNEGVAIDMGAMVFETSDNSWNFEKKGKSTKLTSIDLERNVVNFFTEEGVKTIDTKNIENLAMNRMNNNSTIFASN